MEGFISKIQRYSTADGPGVRSTVFAVGCPLRCRWCQNPELIEPGGKILYHPARCVGCGACVKASGGQIKLGEGGCVIDRAACTNLEGCAAACFYDAYEQIGTAISAEALAAKLLRDKAFYLQSGGGVTYSGGEPGLQADFFLALTRLLKAEGIHTALDTSGHLGWEKLGPLAEAVDLILYDIKAMDADLHIRQTGVDNRLILENARRVAEMGKEMVVRLILVPAVNDSRGEIDRRLAFVRGLGGNVRVEILGYHRLGVGKYAALGLIDPMEGTPACSEEMVVHAANRAAEYGLTMAEVRLT